MKALILAGGFGTRLKEVIHDRPKVMAEIAGKPFLEYLLTLLKKNGIYNIVITVGYLGDYIVNYFGNGSSFGVNLTYSSDTRPLGTGGAVAAAEKFFNEAFLVINGDTYCDTNFFEVFKSHQRKKAKVTVVVNKRKNIGEQGQVVINSRGQVISFIEKPKNFKSGFVNCGIYIFDPGVTKLIKKTRFSLEKDLFPKLAKVNKLYGFSTKEDFLDIGTPENYYKAVEILSKKSKVKTK